MHISHKILSISRLAEITNELKGQGKKIVYCHGVFDLLHIGHIRYFKQAKDMGDVLIVTVTPDTYVDKGPTRPAFSERLRAEAVASLGFVDYVAINKWPTAENTLKLLCPHVYVKGAEFRGLKDPTDKIGKEARVVKEIGAELKFTDDIVFSSSSLINTYLSTLPEELEEYLQLFRKRYSIDEIMALMERMEQLRVLVIGDTIIDRYVYCDPLGISSKDPALAMKFNHLETFAGGVEAISRHVAQFAGEVYLGTFIGERDEYRAFIERTLEDNIHPRFFEKQNAVTTVKERFVDRYSLNKLFEIYYMDEDALEEREEQLFMEWLKETSAFCDLIVVGDFGHGAIGAKMRHELSREDKFICVNTQANAGNRGYHTISKYRSANLVSLAEHELRLEARDRQGDIRPWMEAFSVRLKTDYFIVTRGNKGCAIYSGGSFVQVPALAIKVLDRVGAGDALLSIVSLAAYLNAPLEVIAFLGNLAGACAVGQVGNRGPVTRSSLKGAVKALLK